MVLVAIVLQNEDGTKTEYRVWNPFRSKLAAAILGGVDNIHIVRSYQHLTILRNSDVRADLGRCIFLHLHTEVSLTTYFPYAETWCSCAIPWGGIRNNRFTRF